MIKGVWGNHENPGKFGEKNKNSGLSWRFSQIPIQAIGVSYQGYEKSTSLEIILILFLTNAYTSTKTMAPLSCYNGTKNFLLNVISTLSY